MSFAKFDLTGKRALVTGGGDGLGREFTEALLDSGAEVVICSRRADFIDEVVRDISKSYSSISGTTCDITKYEEVLDLVNRIGKIDILVNSAGLSHRAAWPVPQSKDWQRIMTLNVEAPFWLSQLLMPAMIERSWGRVINISSICGLISGNPAHLPGLGVDMPSYYASKHALIGLTRFLATQVATTGVTVNAICPGPFDSPANREYFSPGPMLDALVTGIPMERIGAEGELRTAIQFLAAPGSSFVTGQSIVVDGGTTVW